MRDVLYAPSLETAKGRAAEVLREFQREYPAAMCSLQEDLDASLVYLRCPLAHHKAIRTTDLLERAFQETGDERT